MNNQDLLNKKNRIIDLIELKQRLFATNEKFIDEINSLNPEKINESDVLYRDLKITENDNLALEIEALSVYQNNIENHLKEVEFEPMSPKDMPNFYQE